MTKHLRVINSEISGAGAGAVISGKAMDNPVLVHPEDIWMSHGNTGDVKRNLLHHEKKASWRCGSGDLQI